MTPAAIPTEQWFATPGFHRRLAVTGHCAGCRFYGEFGPTGRTSDMCRIERDKRNALPWNKQEHFASVIRRADNSCASFERATQS